SAVASTKGRMAALLDRRADSESIAQSGRSGAFRGACHAPDAGTDGGGPRCRLAELVGGRGRRAHRCARTDRAETDTRSAPRGGNRTGAAHGDTTGGKRRRSYRRAGAELGRTRNEA